MADPKRVAARYLAVYTPPPNEQFGTWTRRLVRPKSWGDLPTRDRDKDDTHEQPVSDETSHLPNSDGEVQAGDDPNDNQGLDTSRWPVQQSPNREKQRPLPIPSGHPPQRTRSLIRPVVNVPDAQPGSRERTKTITPIRSPGTPGKEYDHPTKFDYIMLKRRFMEATSEVFQREKENILRWVDGQGDPLTLYRAVKVGSVEDIRLGDLGRFWTPEKNKADSPHGRIDRPGGVDVVIQIRANRKDVDELETVATMRRYPAEREVRLRKGASVLVEGFWVGGKFHRVGKRGKTATIVEAGLKRLFPKQRQRRQTGPAKRYYKRRYLRKRNPIKRYMRRRYRKIRRRPAYKRDQRYREMYPRRYQRKPPGYRENAQRAKDWREKHKVEERRRGIPQRRERERAREQRQRQREKRRANEEIWQFPAMLGDEMLPILINDFDEEAGEVVFTFQETGDELSLPFDDFLMQVVVYEEKDIDWLLDLMEEAFGEDVWDYVDERFEEGHSLEASWEDAAWDLEEEWDDDRLGAYVTFYRVQDKPENLSQNVQQQQDKGTPRKDPKRNDYTYGPPSPGGTKGKEPPTTWVGPMTSQPGIQTPNKDHKHPGQPHGNPDIESGFPQPAVEEQSGSAKVIPDENRETGNLSYRNKDKPTPSTGFKVGTGAQEAWIETGTGTLLPVEILAHELSTRSTVVCDASMAAVVSGESRVFLVPDSKVIRDASHIKTADTIPMIRRRCEKKIINRSKGYAPQYVGYDPSRKVFKFKTGDWEQWVRVLPEPKSKARNIINMPVRIRCSCPFHRWQGPEHWGIEHDYQYGKLQGTATFPYIRDPKFRHAACKHLVAVFDYIKSTKLKIPEPARKVGRYLLDSGENYRSPSYRRVAARSLGKHI